MSEREVTREEVAPLLRDSPLRERIDYLLDNQGLGSRRLTALKEGPSHLNFTVPIYPNCFGTTLFLLGAEKDFLSILNSEVGKNGEHIALSGSTFAVFPRDFDGPGSLQSPHAKHFIEKKCRVAENLKSGSLIFSSGYTSDGEHYLDPRHSAVYLGEIDGKNFIFEQQGRQGIFKFDLLEKMVQRKGHVKIAFYDYHPIR